MSEPNERTEEASNQDAGSGSPSRNSTVVSNKPAKKFDTNRFSENFTPSRPVQDLTGEKLIATAPKTLFLNISAPSLGGILLFAKLGQGGMGAVYLGLHTRLNKEVAVKVLTFSLADSNPKLIERFFREAQLAAKLESSHIIRVYDVDEENGLFYLVMEYVRGVSAQKYLREVMKASGRGIRESVALDICISATKGLVEAHAAGIVHRDLKPDNIMLPMVKDSGKVDYRVAKLADLGLARSDDVSHSLTGSGCLGTPGYMAPEQFEKPLDADKPADVFGMGATLYALLAGHSPFSGDNLMQVMRSTVQDPHADIRSVRSDVSKRTADLIDRCLAKKPGARFADAGELLNALLDCRAPLEKTDSGMPNLTPSGHHPLPSPSNSGETPSGRSGQKKSSNWSGPSLPSPPPRTSPIPKPVHVDESASRQPVSQFLRKPVVLAVAAVALFGLVGGGVLAAYVFKPKTPTEYTPPVLLASQPDTPDPFGFFDKSLTDIERDVASRASDLRSDPTNWDKRLALAQTWVGAARIGLVEDQKTKASQYVDMALKELETLSAERPKDSEATLAKAKAYYVRHLGFEIKGEAAAHRNDAEKTRDFAREAYPSHPRKTDCLTVEAEALEALAHTEDDEQKFDQALELFDKVGALQKHALSLAPKSPVLLSNLGNTARFRAALMNKMKRFDDAEKEYQKAIQLSQSAWQDNMTICRLGLRLAYSWSDKALFLRSRGDMNGYASCMDESCAVFEKLCGQFKDRPNLAIVLVGNLIDMGTFYSSMSAYPGKDKRDETQYLAALDRTVRTARQWAAEYPDSVKLNLYLANAIHSRAQYDFETNNYAHAYTLWSECMDICEKRVWNGKAGSLSATESSDYLDYAYRASGCAAELKKEADVIRVADTAWKIGQHCTQPEGIKSLGMVLSSKAAALRNAGKLDEALAVWKQEVDTCRPILEKNAWHWYLRSVLAGAYRQIADGYQKQDVKYKELTARRNFIKIWGEPVTGIKVVYADPAKDADFDETELNDLREAMGKTPKIKKLPINCDFNGIKISCDIFLTDCQWPKHPLEDQERWLEVVKGGKIPKEVLDAFRDLNKLAHDENKSFVDICNYALDKKKDVQDDK